MERSENKKKQHAITPYPESHSAPRDKRRKLTYRQCDCGLQFCQKGDIQATLEELNCHELLEFKQVYACNNPSTHNQRKHFAFRKSVEFHLKIPLDLVQTGKRYYIHKFHWPIVLVQKRFATTSLLNAKCIKNIEDQQRLLYGITNEALGESRNTYGNLARDVLVGLTLSRDEMLDLHLQVQAPVASRNDIIACIQTLSSERSQRHNIRSHLGDAVPTSESAIVSQHIIGEAQSCPKVSCSTSFERETVDDQPLLVLCATSPTSPLAPRTLLPPTPQSEIVTTPDTIVRKLRQRFQNHLVRGHACEEFLQSKGVGNAWKSLVHVHGLQDPIALAFHGDENKATESEERASYWLIFCKCGSWAEIGQALKKDERICSKCRNDKRKMARRQIQIDKKTQLAHPSSRAPYSSLATPVKVERYKNVRKLAHAEKRRNARLEDVLSKNHAKTLNNSDESANELVSAASQFFAENSDDMVNLIKNIVLAKCGSKKSECEVTEFAEHCVSAIKNFTKIGNGQEKQVRFTPLTLRAALSLWMRCKKGYAIHRMLSVDIMPSQSLLKGILKGNRVNEGKCAKLYGWFSDHHVSERNVCIDAHLMHDELKLVNDVYWNCSNNHMVGLAASVGEFNQLLPEIEVANLFLAATNAIDKDTDTQPETRETNQVINTNRRQQDAMDLWLTYKPAMYVNLWRLRTTKNVSYNCEFFYNNGSLTGDELLRQFLRVAGHCELIGVHILGLLNDAAGQNVKLVDLLTSADTKIAVTGYPLIENVTFANHINPSQSVAVYHCSSHNLKASRNQLLRSHPNGSRLLKMHEAHFGWTEIEECYNRDVLRQPQISKLRKASIEVDSYSSMCVSYAKAPSARETLLEQCLFLAEALMCDRQLKDLDLRNAQEVYENAIPLFRSKLTPQTAYHIRSCLNTLEYTSVVGAIFNDFFLNSKVMITRDNIDAYETTMKTFVGNFYDRWCDSIDPSETRKNRLKHFISSITYKNLRLSMRGFFEYCRLALFKSSNPPDFVLVSHSNSSSIESVFSLARSQKRDTPQGFCTSIAVQSSTEAIAVVKTFDKPAYSSEDIPDVDVRNTFDLLSRRDAEREQIFSDFLKARNEINANAATTSYQVENIFEGIDSSCLSPGYRRLHDILVGNAKQRLGMKGFLGLLLGNEKDFVATAKASIFTVNESWYKSLYSLEGDDEMNFNSACSCILLILFQNLYEASAFNRKHVLSSYHHRLYKMMKERNHVAWKIVIDKLPTCLRLKDAPVCLLIQCLSDILLEWVYDAMSARLSEKKIEREAIASSRQSNATNTVDNSQDVIMSQVQRFFGWSIFSLKRKLENEQCDNKDGLDLLEKMSVFHHEVINDELYMKNCYPIANEVMNKGGLTLVATNFIGFGRSLMTMVKKLTVETVLQKGNRAIEDLVSDVLHSEKLKRIFWSCCETSYSKEMSENTSTNTLQSLYTALTKKTIHAWAGMISRRFKELYTGRQAKNTTKLPLRVELEASSKSTKKKAAKMKNEESLQNLHKSEGIVVDPNK